MLLIWLIRRTSVGEDLADWIDKRIHQSLNPTTDALFLTGLGNVLPAIGFLVVSAVLFGSYNSILDLDISLLNWWNDNSQVTTGTCNSSQGYDYVTGIVGLGGLVIVMSLIWMIWGILTCALILIIAAARSTTPLAPENWYPGMGALLYIGSSMFFLLAVDILFFTAIAPLLMAVVLFLIDFAYHGILEYSDIRAFLKNGYTKIGGGIIGMLYVVILLILLNWMKIINQHIKHCERWMIMFAGIIWAVALVGPVWIYLLIVRKGYVAVVKCNIIDQNTIIIWTFILALNGVVFAIIKKLYKPIKLPKQERA